MLVATTSAVEAVVSEQTRVSSEEPQKKTATRCKFAKIDTKKRVLSFSEI